MRAPSWQWAQPARELAGQAAQRPDRFVIVRYEDLVRRPEPVLRELLEWLGEPWSPSVLEHHTVQAGRGGKRKVEGFSAVDDPIDETRVAKWTTRMLEEHRAWLEERVGPLAEFFGYGLGGPDAVEPVSADGGVLLHGGELVARIERFPSLELRKGGDGGPYDEPYDPRELMVLRRSEYAQITSPRGVRRIGIKVVRALPFERARRAAIKGVRRVRGKLGMTRRYRAYRR